MKYLLKAPNKLNTTIDLPASKSISNRALIIHALSGKAILPENLSDCDDTEVIIRALASMPKTIDIGAAGTAMRFMAAYLSTIPEEHILTGTTIMKQRPISILVDALRFLGAKITYQEAEGFPPILIKGGDLRGGDLEVQGSISSQYISALLMIGPTLKEGLNLKLLGNIISRPYIDMTLSIMRDFGAKAEWTSSNSIRVMPEGYSEREYQIENDWSAASYWYEMVALSNSEDTEVKLLGLMDGSHQGDSSVRYLFNMLGVKTIFKIKDSGVPTQVTLKKTHLKPSRLDYDFKNQPDMAQTFVVCCALMDIPFHFIGLSTLKIKETDRLEALKTEMEKLGYIIRVDAEKGELYWDGEKKETSSIVTIDTYEDHRMAMAFAPIALRRDGIEINSPKVVSKSYPHYWDDLRKAGFLIEEKD